jgi:hypothetical protein
MTASPQRVPHVRDSLIVANVGMITFLKPPPDLHPAETSETPNAKVEVES